jgi:nucleoid-associated protein YgaU
MTASYPRTEGLLSWKSFDVCIDMHDPAVKLALALSILLGGFLAAMALRPRSSAPSDPAPSWSELVALRGRRLPENRATILKGKTILPPASPAAGSSSVRSPTVVAPLDNPPQVPMLSPKYPGDGAASTTGWGMPLVPPAGRESAGGARTHKIEDGDTLPALAARYLGSADRAMEIFKANRDLLSDPELLPIGAELRIPQ